MWQDCRAMKYEKSLNVYDFFSLPGTTIFTKYYDIICHDTIPYQFSTSPRHLRLWIKSSRTLCTSRTTLYSIGLDVIRTESPQSPLSSGKKNGKLYGGDWYLSSFIESWRVEVGDIGGRFWLDLFLSLWWHPLIQRLLRTPVLPVRIFVWNQLWFTDFEE